MTTHSQIAVSASYNASLGHRTYTVNPLQPVVLETNMSDWQTENPDKIIKHFAEVGKVEPAAVETLRKRLQSDWVITEDEAEMLFQINRQVGEHPKNCPSWTELYVDAISRYVVFDMNTPGEVSESEAQWLRKHLASEVDLTSGDAQLLNHIRGHASQCCESLGPLFTRAAAFAADAMETK